MKNEILNIIVIILLLLIINCDLITFDTFIICILLLFISNDTHRG